MHVRCQTNLIRNNHRETLGNNNELLEQDSQTLITNTKKININFKQQ